AREVALRQALFHRGDVVVRETVGLQVREAPVALAVVRAQPYAFAIRRDRLLLPPDRFQHVPQPELRAREPRRELEGLAILLEGAVSERRRRERGGELEVRLRVFGLELEHLFMQLDRFLEAVLLLQHAREILHRADEKRRE